MNKITTFIVMLMILSSASIAQASPLDDMLVDVNLFVEKVSDSLQSMTIYYSYLPSTNYEGTILSRDLSTSSKFTLISLEPKSQVICNSPTVPLKISIKAYKGNYQYFTNIGSLSTNIKCDGISKIIVPLDIKETDIGKTNIEVYLDYSIGTPPISYMRLIKFTQTIVPAKPSALYMSQGALNYTIYQGSNSTSSFVLQNMGETDVSITFKTSGDAINYIEVPKPITIKSNDVSTINVKVNIPTNTNIGLITGRLDIIPDSGGVNYGKIININIIKPVITPKVLGFEALLAIFGLLIVSWRILKNEKNKK